MALLRFFRVPKHQKFEYKSRFYDPAKEELEERMQRIRNFEDNNTDAMKARISSGFRRGGHVVDGSFRSQQVRRSNFILLGVIVVLLLLCYLFLTTYIPEFSQLLDAKNG